MIKRNNSPKVDSTAMNNMVTGRLLNGYQESNKAGVIIHGHRNKQLVKV